MAHARACCIFNSCRSITADNILQKNFNGDCETLICSARSTTYKISMTADEEKDGGRTGGGRSNSRTRSCIDLTRVRCCVFRRKEVSSSEFSADDDEIETSKACWLVNRLRIHSDLVRQFLAEFLGTAVMLVFGIGSVAQSVLSRTAKGEYLSVVFGWGWGVTMGISVAGGVSGGHLNPTVTLCNVLLCRLPLYRLPVYWLAQYLGGLAASACIYGVYYDALNSFDGGKRQIFGVNGTAGIWATYPQPYLTTLGGFGDQIFGTAMLLLGVMAITDERNMGVPKALVPLSVGTLVAVIGATIGLNCGYAINPARDLPPRFFTAIAGWGWQVFTVCNYWSWVPVVAPHIGAVCGVLLYQLLIGLHMTTTAQSAAAAAASQTDAQTPRRRRVEPKTPSTTEADNDNS